MRLRELLLVILKNFRLQFRRPLITFFELIFPILAVSIVVVVRYGIPQFTAESQCFVTFESDHLIQPYTGNFTIFYTPDNQDTRFVAAIIESQLNSGYLIPVESEQDIIDRVEVLEEQRPLGCFLYGSGIVFNLNGTSPSYTLRLRHETPTREEYRTSWSTTITSPLSAPSGPRVYENAYFNEGFLQLQHFTSLAIIRWITNRWPAEIASISMKQMPYPHYKVDDFLVYVSFILPFAITAAYLLSVGLFTKDLVREKETRMRQMLKTMGLSNFTIGAAWVIKQFLYISLPSIIFTLILKYAGIFPYSNPVALLILMFCYMSSMISFCFLVSVWFNSSRLGMMAAFIFWFLTYIPHLFVARFFDSLAIEIKILACLLSNTCIGMAVDVISILELREEGFQFSDFYSKLSVDDSFNMNFIVGMLLLDTLLQFLLAWYVSEVKPGEYGIPKKFYFPFQFSYWTGTSIKLYRRSKVGSTNANDLEEIITPSASTATFLSENSVATDTSLAHELIHPEPSVGIEVKRLKKLFKAHQYTSRAQILAVNDITLKIYKGHITVLLGHNGAGKSTLISLMTSFYPPSEGVILFEGVDQLKNINTKKKASLGICAQYNLLFDDLSVREHLQFFASLKEVKDVKSAVAKTIKELELEEFSEVKAANLSGGYQRKLSLGVALIGDPDILILDEPTSGMDLVARNLTWKLLEDRKKSNRTIVLTTHNMDDAEKADRIAMMVEGKIACSGTPGYLKKRYGVGYSLKIEAASEEFASEVEGKVQLTCPRAEKYRLKQQIQFLLPYEEMPMFSSLFRWLEKLHKDKKLTNFSVQENRMVDAFIKVREGNCTSWDSHIKKITKMISAAPTISSHRPLLGQSPTLFSFNSVDLNNQFEGIDGDNDTGLETISEEQDGGFPVLERRVTDRSLSFSSGSSPVIVNSGRKLSSRSISSSSSLQLMSPAVVKPPHHVTPSILNSIYEEDNDETDVEGADKGKPVKDVLSSKTGRWLQQYWAMLIKRYYNFIRFRVGFVWQFVFPVLFVLLGLALAVTVPAAYRNNPTRILTLSRSAPNSADMNMFWADFSLQDFTFEANDLLSSFFGVRSVDDITDKVTDIRDAVRVRNSTKDCCTYPYQILDTFCALKTQEELLSECAESTEFGFYRCLDNCLGCCGSKEYQLPSCSNPRYQQLGNRINVPVASNFCPVLPKLSVYDDIDLSSPLNTMDTFVNEYLLKESAMYTNRFFESNIGGFTIMENLPAYTTCQCNHSPPDTDVVDYAYTLITDACGRTRVPVYSSHCNESSIIQSLLNSSFSLSSAAEAELLQNLLLNGSPSCVEASLDLLRRQERCVLGVPCVDETCKQCDCHNQTHSSWYGELKSDYNSSIILWYNNEHYHVAPAMLAAFHNLYLRNISKNFSITVYNHPLPRNVQNAANVIEADVIIFAIGGLSSFGFSFLVASYALFIVHEKSSKAKHLQVVSGLHRSAYWLANLTWDLMSSMLPVVTTVLLIILARLFLDHFNEAINVFAVFLLFFFLCWAEIPLIYMISYIFDNMYTAYTSIFILTSMTMLTFCSIVYLLNIIADNDVLADTLHYIFLLNPSYGLAVGMSDLYYNHVVKESCSRSAIALVACEETGINFFDHPFEFSRPGIGVILIYMFVEGLFFIILTIMVDHKDDIVHYFGKKKNWSLKKHHEHERKKNQDLKFKFEKSKRFSGHDILEMSKRRSSTSMIEGVQRSMSQPRVQDRPHAVGFTRSFTMHIGSRAHEDISVRNEKRHVGNILRTEDKELSSDYSLVISRVTKYYGNRVWSKLRNTVSQQEPPLPALMDVNLKVQESECFGLAGFNGAGKTTIFKILTGEVQSTSGVVTVCGHNIGSHFYVKHGNLGYCPQFDSLVERMTGREILTMFARIRGLRKAAVQREVCDKLDLLQLNNHADKLFWKYSGGNRRKLSAAVALIGDPKVILLDEPTTGMDIEMRGKFVRMLKQIVEKKKTSIILTSHSMGECEAVCNRIGIMIKGKFRCIGSTEELKNKYGEQNTKVLIRVQSYTSSQQSIAQNQQSRLKRRGSVYHRLHTLSRVISTVAVKKGPQQSQTNVIEEVSESSSGSETEERIEDEVDAVAESDLGGVPIIEDNDDNDDVIEPIDDDEEQQDYVNYYLIEVCRKFESEFSSAHPIKVIEYDSDEASYKLPRNKVPLSRIFEVMERMKSQFKYHIISYSVTQSTLEQVYTFFDNEQHKLKLK